MGLRGLVLRSANVSGGCLGLGCSCSQSAVEKPELELVFTLPVTVCCDLAVLALLQKVTAPTVVAGAGQRAEREAGGAGDWVDSGCPPQTLRIWGRSLKHPKQPRKKQVCGRARDGRQDNEKGIFPYAGGGALPSCGRPHFWASEPSSGFKEQKESFGPWNGVNLWGELCPPQIPMLKS